MSFLRISLALLIGSLIATQLFAQESNDESADREAIRAAIVDYVKAVNDSDATAAASYWSDSGVWIGPDGAEIVGSKAIEKHMTEMYANNEMSTLELIDVNVRFIAPGVATEEGHVLVTRPGESTQKSTYISIHVKTDKGWKLDSVRETLVATKPSNYMHLRELDWMVGQWRDQEGDVSVETTCEWTSNRNFLLRTFRASKGENVELEGTQLVGWDADRQQIRSWVFDSDGGFGSGHWTRSDSVWTIDATFQTSDGVKGSSVNRFTRLDDDRFEYESTDRVLGDEMLPDVEKLIVTRVNETIENQQNEEH